MGVSLGERLIPGVEGNNSKGFWEDIDLNTLDNEMLHAIDSDWQHLATIESVDVGILRKQGYFLRAVELLRRKVESALVFGIKDPRVAKLLPFWKEVFNHCKLDVSYVMAVRHPLSVAKSLAKRDGIETAQSYLLWLGHVITSLTDSAGDRRVLADYDRLMQSPDHELNRMAKHLDLAIDPSELQRYKTEFLDHELRHSVYDLNDLLLDDTCPPIVREVYTALLDVASDKAGFDDLKNKVVRWSDEFERLKSPFLLIDKLFVQKMIATQAVAVRDEQITNLNQAAVERQAAYQSHIIELESAVGAEQQRYFLLASEAAKLVQVITERDNQITNLNQATTEQNELISSFNQAISEQDSAVVRTISELNGQIASLNQAISERDNAVVQTIADLDGQITSLSQLVSGQEGQITSLNQAASENDGHIANLNRALAERVEQIAILNQAISERDSAVVQMIAGLDGQITSLSQLVSGKEGQIAHLNQAVTDHQAAYQCHVIELESAVWAEQQRYFLMGSETTNLRFQLDSTIASRSWTLTAPLRQISTFAHKAPATLFRRSVTIYRTLPITPLQRQKLKNLVFGLFGFAFVRMGAYKRWKEYQDIQMDWPSTVQVAKVAPVISMLPRTIATLPSADGRWEWSEYTAVKSRISQIKAQQLSQVSPSTMELIDIGKESFSSAAARVKLPAPIAAPDISIILPVFNNLQLTLECLLSITAYSDPDISYEIIVADDASTDETAQIIESIPHLRVIRNDSNLGFLRNCNNALKHVQGNYVLYLNNDVQVTSGWLSSLLCTFNTHPKVGAVGPRFVYPSGHLQEAGAAFRPDGTADMVGLNGDSTQARFSYTRRVDYVSGACLMLPTSLAKQLNGFSEEFLPCYCEDSDLCLSVQQAGYYVYYNPAATIVHHLSKTTASIDNSFKMGCISKNLVTFQNKWQQRLGKSMTPKVIAFYLPQFHPIPENNKWWGNGFTEWANVTKAQANFVGHYQPRIPADLGYYDLRLSEVMEQQAELARRYGVGGFCFYYYWFDGKRLLDRPIEQMLETGKPDFPFCLCWANENWTRRWDGMDHEILMSQSHSQEDDRAVILDLIRFFRDQRYIRVDDRPLILVYRITLFPNFAETATLWRNICREQGIGEIYIAMVESMDMVHANKHPKEYGCDAAVEFPPQGLAEQKQPSGDLINPDFAGSVADYRDLAVRYATREAPAYTRFKGVIPGWDNTARRQNNSFCFEHATPGAFQAWLEETIEQTRMQQYGDERLIFVNAWNEWAEGAYLEPDRRFGHTYLEAVRNALDAASLLRKSKYALGDNEE